MQLLDIMQLDSVDLLSREGEQGTVGAGIRKEITRRNAIGYWKGDFAKQVVKEQEEEVYIIGSKVSMPTARKVEKKMAGRGR
tara:strand:- start:411 stop:656 length:246 start_codon:yes stop_codon:yes gene_type:complete